MHYKVLILSFIFFGKFLSAQEYGENIILNCLNSRYDSLNVAILDELELYENYLMEYKFLTEKTVKGYRELFATLFDETQKGLPEFIDYRIDKVNINNYHLFNQCIHAQLPNLPDSSQIKYMYCEISNIRAKTNMAMREIMALITTALSVDEFESKLEKYYILYNFYYLSSAHVYNSNDTIILNANNRIDNYISVSLTIIKKNKIYFNSEKIEASNLKEELLTYCTAQKIDSHELRVIISTSSKVKPEFLEDIKTILHNTGITRIQLTRF